MVKHISIIKRIGSKIDDLKYFRHLLPLDAKTVVEPFGGGFAVSKIFYKDINKYNFHINDKDEILMYIYKHYNEYISIYNKIVDTYLKEYLLLGKEKGGRIRYYMTDAFKTFINDLDIHPNFKTYFKNTQLTRGFTYITSSTNYNPDEKLILDNALLTCEDYSDILEQYKDDKDAFLFLDPPYLFSDNSMYDPLKDGKDMTQIIVDILKYLKTCSCRVMLIINKLSILSYLFKDYIKGEYNRVYRLSCNKAKHLIITNY